MIFIRICKQISVSFPRLDSYRAGLVCLGLLIYRECSIELTMATVLKFETMQFTRRISGS